MKRFIPIVITLGILSAFAWTLAHLANQVDAWINVRIAGAEPNPVVSDAHYRFGGDGRARGWDEVRDAWASIRQAAARHLEGLDEAALNRTQPYPGSLAALKGRDVPLRHTLLRVLAHAYFHIGEVGSKRSTAGRSVGDYPSAMLHALETDR